MTSKLDEMLSAWPLPQRSQLEADEAAERVVSAVQAGQLPATIDESLLASPLPKTSEDQDPLQNTQSLPPRSSKPGSATPGIGVESKMAKDRTRDRTSFQELAKLATTPPPPASVGGVHSEKSGPHAPIPPSASSSGSTGVVRGDEAQASDSGIIDLKAIASADPTGSHRAQTTPLASQGLFDEEESAPPKPSVSDQAAAKLAPASDPKAVASAVAQPATVATKAKTTDTKSPADKKSGGGVVIVLGALVAAGAIAAGVFFFVKSQHHQAAVAKATVTTPADNAAGTKVKTQAGGNAAGAVSVAQADTELDTAVDTNAAQTGGQRPMFKFHSKPGVASGGASSAAPEATAAGGVDPKLIANVPTGPAGGGSGDLAEAMKTAAGGGTGLGQGGGGGGTTTTTQGNVAQRPSQGQVAGAINSVMPSVRACLGSDDPVSHATVTVQSDGTVKSVSVTGFAAGKPQEACIKGALSKMTVSPFAEATYPIPVTIRPN
jgi:hypothetical protein